MFTTFDNEFAREELKNKYGIRRKKIGNTELRRAERLAKRRIAMNLAESYADQTWLQRKILNAPASTLARNIDPNILMKRQVRHDDIETFLRRFELPFYEIQNMRIRTVAKRCYEAGGGKKCSSKTLYWHRKSDPYGMCYRCTSRREV